METARTENGHGSPDIWSDEIANSVPNSSNKKLNSHPYYTDQLVWTAISRRVLADLDREKKN